MHFHDKDIVVVYRYDGSLKSTTPDGKSVVNRLGMILQLNDDQSSRTSGNELRFTRRYCEGTGGGSLVVNELLLVFS
jgi:hypothetical protein